MRLLLGVLLLCVAGCGRGTFLSISLTGSTGAPIATVSVTLDTGGRMGKASLIRANAPFRLPQSLAVRLPDDVSGSTFVAVDLLGAADNRLGRATTVVDVRTATTTPVELRFGDGDGPRDLASPPTGDLAEVDSGSPRRRVGFQARTYPAGEGPIRLVLSDWNTDVSLDIAVSNNVSGDVSILRNLGTGAVVSAGRYPIGMHPAGLSAGDLDKDGKNDIVVAVELEHGVAVLAGRGDGSFAAARTYDAGRADAALAALCVADFDGDGWLDVAAADHRNDSALIFASSVGGTLKLRSTIAAGPTPTSVAVADLNGDGEKDLAFANFLDARVSVVLGSGLGAFKPVPRPFATDAGPIMAKIADVNGDGRPDILSANRNSSSVSVLLSQGDGVFKGTNVVGSGAGVTAITTADFDGDHVLDVALSYATDGKVGVLLGRGDGTFEFPAFFATGTGPNGIEAGDMDGDGFPDIVVVNEADNSVTVLLNRAL